MSEIPLNPVATLWTLNHWIVFTCSVLVLLILDLLVLHRKNEAPNFRQSVAWTIFWCFLALCFNAYIYFYAGKDKAIEFLSGYLIEWSLSMDNVFVFAVIFKAFKIPLKNQYRVLFWGILGAIVLRFIFVIVGAEILKQFNGAMVVFGAFLIYTGVRLVFQKEDEVDPEQGWAIRMAKKIFPIAGSSTGGQEFTVRKNGKLYFTPLFLVLVAVESTDVLFAVDSVPAVFGVTRDAFLVFSSNICAILGLRSLYFMLAGFMDIFKYLHYGLSAILVFVGFKMNLEFWFPRQDGHHWFGPAESLGVVVGILLLTIIVSILHRSDTTKS